MTGTLRNSSFSLNTLLRASATTLQGRVYPPGLRMPSAKLPRAHITQFTPAEQISGIGCTIDSFADLRFSIDVFGESPGQVELASDDVIQVIKANRNYVPATNIAADDKKGDLNASIASNGTFLMLRISGGTDTLFMPDQQLYRRSISISGKWHQTA